MFSNRAELADLRRRLQRVERLLEAMAVHLEVPPPAIEQAIRPQVSPEVAELVAAGKKIAAIKLLREEQQLDLVSAKQIVDRLEA